MSYDPTSLKGVPEAGRERLRRMRESGRFFTSDLSVNEFLLVKQAGFEPLGLVVGNSIYHIGLQTRRWGKNLELHVLTQAMYHARELSMTRMQAEAEALEAEGVVGVELHERSHGWGSHVIEFLAIGTAIIPTKADHQIPPPALILNLNDPPPTLK